MPIPVFDSKKSELHVITSESEEEEAKMMKSREKAGKNIEERLLKSYTKIRNNAKNGLAVVSVKRGACGGCFNMVPPQRQAEVREKKKLIVCEHCGRIFADVEDVIAAPDVDMKTYIEQLPAYFKLANSTTIAMNPDDFVLNIARIHQGTPRLGRPDATVLNEQQILWLTEASNEGTLNVIRILPEILSDHDPGAHDFWFSHPWVSTDVLIQLLFHATPLERGLMAEYTEQFKWWYFPQDYPEKIVDLLKEQDRKADYP